MATPRRKDGEAVFVGWYTRDSLATLCEGWWSQIPERRQLKCCVPGIPGDPLPTIP